MDGLHTSGVEVNTVGVTAKVIGLSLNFQPEKSGTPPSAVRTINEPRQQDEDLDFAGLNTEQICRKVCASVKFNSDRTVVFQRQTYSHVEDESINGALIRLFGPRLSSADLETNLDRLTARQWGWVAGVEDENIDLNKAVLKQRVVDLAMAAVSSLSPSIISAVCTILTVLSESINTVQAIVSKRQMEANIFCAENDQIILVSSRFLLYQKTSGWSCLLCGYERTGMMLSLSIRHIHFTRAFILGLQEASPQIVSRIGPDNMLLPPSPLLSGRSATAPSSVPIRAASRDRLVHSLHPSPVQSTLQTVPENGHTEPSPLSVLRDLPARIGPQA